MKSEKYLHQLFGKELQKQMDEDLEDMILAEQKTRQKLQPAYINEDYWKEKKEAKGNP
jgi:hypothetical protein